MKKLVLIATLLLIGLVAQIDAHAAGWDGGNAGDAYSAEFLFSSRDVLQRLEILAASGLPVMETAKLRNVMQTTVVVSEERIYVNGLERDAVNYPERKLIKISRSRWKTLRQSEETRARLTLVLHEFLWMSGVDDTNFQKSGQVINVLNIPNYSPAIWLNVPGLAFAVAECTGRMSEGTFVTVRVSTKGVTKSPNHGEVKIQRGGNVFGYRFGAEEVAQFFEFDDVASNTAMVGISAFVKREYPVLVKYVGVNYADMDLRAVIEARGSKPDNEASGNFLRVWKGPGHDVSDQYQVTDAVCSVSSRN
jgi:hypothetical protein